MLQREVDFHIVAAETVIVIGIRVFCPPVNRLSLGLFIVFKLPSQLLRLVRLVNAVAVIAFAGEHDLIAAVGRKGVFLIDRVHLVRQILNEFCQAFFPDVVISVIVSFIVNFQPVLEIRSVQDPGPAARQVIHDPAAGQFVELLDILSQSFIVLADLGRQIDALPGVQIQVSLLDQSGIQHGCIRSFHVQCRSVHFRRHAELTVLIVQKCVLRLDHIGALRLRHCMEDRKQLFSRILSLFRNLVPGIPEYAQDPFIGTLFFHQAVQPSVRNIMIINIFSFNCQRIAVPEGNLHFIVSQDFLHFTDGHCSDFISVDDRTGNESVSIVVCFAADNAAGQRCDGNARCDRALLKFIFSFYHMYFLVSHPRIVLVIPRHYSSKHSPLQ